jgi:hypothetical protein
MTALARRFATEYAFAYRWSVAHVGPARWLFGALFMPGTPARAAVTALPYAARNDLDSGA